MTALAIYAGVLSASFYLAYEIRFDFAVPPEFQTDRLRLLKYALVIKLVLLVLFRQTGSVLRYFSLPDLFRIGMAMGIASSLAVTSRWVNGGNYVIPRGVMLVDFILSLGALCVFRLALRVLQERLLIVGQFPAKALDRIAIVGAGNTGASLAKDLLNMPARGLRPVAFFDDDPRKRGTFVHGVEVLGAPDLLPQSKVADIKSVVIAMPSAPQKRMREVAITLAKQGYRVDVVPALEDLASGRAKASRIRPIEVEDLLGREEVELDTNGIRQFVSNKVVMVTGAGGSIGSELCRQIARLNPRRLLMVEQSEPSLFLIEQELNAQGFSGIVVPLVADILDTARMNALFGLHSPAVVFHAAAHKHVFMMERQPSEAVKNNAVGTRKLAGVAIAHRAEVFIQISTDKAVNPTNVMGASKRLAELHLQALHTRLVRSHYRGRNAAVPAKQPTLQRLSLAGESGKESTVKTLVSERSSQLEAVIAGHEDPSSRTKIMAVRFGNVLGSSGSVVPIFKKQIEAGGPVTVTHPDVTRYFMTIPEAVGLVLQASVMGQGGEIFVLDMGEPMKIVDLARQMIELSGFKVGEDIDIQFTGLKAGEKLFEELQHQTEHHVSTEHPRIMRFVNGGDATAASEMAIRELEPFVDELSPMDLKRQLKVVISEYVPCLE